MNKYKDEFEIKNNGRRKFIAKAAASSLFISVFGGLAQGLTKESNKPAHKLLAQDIKTPKADLIEKGLRPEPNLTVGDIISQIIKKVPEAPFPNTLDSIKAGSLSMVVNGIVTCMFPTLEVIDHAQSINANFIIAHEPTYYNHADNLNWVKDSRVIKQKVKALAKAQITIWRFHDYWHAVRPDRIFYGVALATGWSSFVKAGSYMLSIPSISLKNLCEHLKKSLHIEHLRVIGNLNQSCSRIALIPGAAGGEVQVSLVENENPDVLIVGELREWETAEYIRDSLKLGFKTSLIVLGHAASEEPGMEFLVDWLNPMVGNLKITHVASGNPFQWI